MNSNVLLSFRYLEPLCLECCFWTEKKVHSNRYHRTIYISSAKNLCTNQIMSQMLNSINQECSAVAPRKLSFSIVKHFLISSRKHVFLFSESLNFIPKFSKILRRLCNLEESLPFKTSLYSTSESVTSQEIDLVVVQSRLSSGYYNSDPWLFVNDVWLIFDYARLYNSPTSRVYKCCTVVSYISQNVLLVPTISFVYKINYSSLLKSSIEKSIQLWRNWVTVADAGTYFYHKYCIVLETKPVESQRILIITKIEMSKHLRLIFTSTNCRLLNSAFFVGISFVWNALEKPPEKQSK